VVAKKRRAAPSTTPVLAPPSTSPDAPAARRRAPIAILAAIELVVALTYANGLDGGFLLDARALIPLNPTVHVASWRTVAALFSQDYWNPFGAGGLYRPATTVSFLVDYAVLGNGERPLGYHLTNLALHLACVALLYALVLRLARRPWAAAVAAALFGLHPITTEAVTYIAGRADLLMAAGTLGAIFLHADRRRSPFALPAFVLAAALASFAKESGLVLVGILLAHDLLLGARRGARARYAAIAVVLVLYALGRHTAATTDVPVTDTPALDNPLVAVGPVQARLTALALTVKALGLLLWPRRLSADYSCCAITPIGWPPTIAELGALLLAAGIAAAVVAWSWRQRGPHPERTFFVVLACLAALPASNLLVVIGTPLAERTLYLPAAGLAALVACVLDDLRRRAARGAIALQVGVAVVLVAFAWRTHLRNEDWRSETSLWSSALTVVPDSAKANAALAAALFVEDGPRADLDRIVALGERAIAIQPDYQNALVALGGHSVVLGDRLAAAGQSAAARARYDRAVAVLERARGLDDAAVARLRARLAGRATTGPAPGDANLYNNLSLAYARTGRGRDALAAYQRSRDLDPLNPHRQADVGATLGQLQRWDDAAVAFWTALLLSPDDDTVELQLAEVYRRLPAEGARAIVESGGRAQILIDHPAVRRHRCRAMADLVAHLRTGGRAADADALQSRLNAECGTADTAAAAPEYESGSYAP
jgi:tetratricopeptide (TPR) repeat protein